MATWVDLRRSREKPQAVANINDLVVLDFLVLAPGDDLEQIAIGADGRCGQTSQLTAGHLLFGDRVMNTIDLDLKLLRTMGFLVLGHLFLL
jgi:hypothetical protein